MEEDTRDKLTENFVEKLFLKKAGCNWNESEFDLALLLLFVTESFLNVGQWVCKIYMVESRITNVFAWYKYVMWKVALSCSLIRTRIQYTDVIWNVVCLPHAISKNSFVFYVSIRRYFGRQQNVSKRGPFWLEKINMLLCT